MAPIGTSLRPDVTDSHDCPAAGCTAQVPYAQFACRAHWYSIPKPLRDELWRAYRVDGQLSDAHLAAMSACRAYLAGRDPVPRA